MVTNASQSGGDAHEGVADVVPVADRGEGDAEPSEALAERHRVGQGLERMRIVREPVDHRDRGVLGDVSTSSWLNGWLHQEEVETFAEHASIPVINGLTDDAHPLQALADAMTLRERFGSLAGVRLAYVGDGNNVCNSLMRIAARLGMHFVAATPPGYEPRSDIVAGARADADECGGSVEVTTDPVEAAHDAQALYTDVWTSMGQEAERERRLRDLEPYRIDARLLAEADSDAVALHCLPAHADEEIAADVLYGPRCLAWEQAENRLHTQKALMALVIR